MTRTCSQSWSYSIDVRIKLTNGPNSGGGGVDSEHRNEPSIELVGSHCRSSKVCRRHAEFCG